MNRHDEIQKKMSALFKSLTEKNQPASPETQYRMVVMQALMDIDESMAIIADKLTGQSHG